MSHLERHRQKILRAIKRTDDPSRLTRLRAELMAVNEQIAKAKERDDLLASGKL